MGRGGRNKKSSSELNLNKNFGLGFQTVHFFWGGRSYQKPHQKIKVFLAEKPQAKAAADAWAAEASEAAKRAKGKVEHGGVGYFQTKPVRDFQKYCWLMERGCIKLTVNN